MLEGLELLITAAVDAGSLLRAAQLAGAAEVIREGLRDSSLPHAETGASAAAERDAILQVLRSQLNKLEFEMAWRRGRAMCLDAIAAFALGCNGDPATSKTDF